MLAGLAFCEILSQYPRPAFQGFCRGDQRESAAVCNPNPPRPFARYRFLESAETPLFVQINVFPVRALRLDRKYTNSGTP